MKVIMPYRRSTCVHYLEIFASMLMQALVTIWCSPASRTFHPPDHLVGNFPQSAVAAATQISSDEKFWGAGNAVLPVVDRG
jgi:hypothetical protein